jgi:hypothetical protein
LESDDMYHSLYSINTRCAILFINLGVFESMSYFLGHPFSLNSSNNNQTGGLF